MKNKNANRIVTYFGMIYIIATVIICGISCSLISKWRYVNIPADGLSEFYSEITIGYDRELIDLHHYDTLGLIEQIKKTEDSFRLQKCTNSNYSWIYLNNMNIGIEIIQGRSFSEEDFNMNKNVAMVSEDYYKRLLEQNYENVITIDGWEYEIIGVFKNTKNLININSDIFLSMLSENYIYGENDIEGRYWIDTKKNCDRTVKELDEWCRLIRNKSVFEKNKQEQYQIVMDAMIIPIGLIYGIVIFMLLSISYITIFWLSSLKKEIYIHRLCGANRKDIYLKILKMYSKNVIYSYVGVVLLTIASMNMGNVLMVMVAIYLLGLTYSMFFSYLYGRKLCKG